MLVIWTFTRCIVNMHHVPTRRTPVPMKMPITTGAFLRKASEMTPGHVCRKSGPTVSIRYSWAQRVKQCALQRCSDHWNRFITTHRHDEVLHPPVWLGTGHLNELYHTDARHSTAVKLQNTQEKKGWSEETSLTFVSSMKSFHSTLQPCGKLTTPLLLQERSRLRISIQKLWSRSIC